MTNTEVEAPEVPEIRDPAGLLAAYEQAKADLVALRTENKTLKETVESAGTDEVSAEWKKRALTAETRLALNSQGIKDVDRLMPYVGTDGLDFDEKGNVTGLNERLSVLKKDLPEIFDPKRRAGGKADIFADSSTEVKEDPFKAAIHRALHGPDA